MKRLVASFLGNTPGFLAAAWFWATSLLMLDFLLRLLRKNDVAFTASQLSRIALANLPWILSTSILMALAYGLAIPTAVKDLSRPVERKRHVRAWLMGAFLLSPLYFLHVNVILPEGNRKAYLVRMSIIHEGDSALIRPSRSDRELGIGAMRDSLKVIPARMQAVREGGKSPEGKARVLASLRKWESSLMWEIAKKVQMTLLVPLTAAFALAAGIFLQRSRRTSARFMLAAIMAKAYSSFIFLGMARIEKAFAASGYSAAVAWLPILGLGLAALACIYPVLGRGNGRLPDFAPESGFREP